MPISEKLLHVDGLELQLLRSKRRTLGLELSPTGLKARAPLRMSERDIIDFVRHKRDWIDKHLKTLPKTSIAQPLELVSGATIKLRGVPYSLEIQPGSRGKIQILPNRIVVPVIQSQRPLSETVRAKLIRWYKEIAQHELQIRARFYAQRMALSERRTDQIYVRDYKRRWGCCDQSGKLSFNWRILQAPTAVSDYVVIHELAHCHEFNHSKRFWSIVTEQMPDYKQQEHWLYQYGHQLYHI